MSKKRKLNSTNPKYYPQKEESKDRKELIAIINKGRKRNINVYAVFSEIE